MMTARPPVFPGWDDVEMLEAPSARCALLQALVQKLWSGYECRHNLNVPCAPVLTYFFITSSLGRTYVNSSG